MGKWGGIVCLVEKRAEPFAGRFTGDGGREDPAFDGTDAAGTYSAKMREKNVILIKPSNRTVEVLAGAGVGMTAAVIGRHLALRYLESVLQIAKGGLQSGEVDVTEPWKAVHEIDHACEAFVVGEAFAGMSEAGGPGSEIEVVDKAAGAKGLDCSGSLLFVWIDTYSVCHITGHVDHLLLGSVHLYIPVRETIPLQKIKKSINISEKCQVR